MNPLSQLLEALAQQPAVLVTVCASRGSVPRERGAWMAVFADTCLGTVGGGRLEWDATHLARQMLHAQGGALAPEALAGQPAQLHRFALGPALGQCCGGEVQLQLEWVGPAQRAALAQRLRPAHAPLVLFGGGHVGQALVQVLGALPFDVDWVDSRDSVFPPQVPANVRCEHSDPVHAAVAGMPAAARVVIMSFSHAEDLDIVAACLQRQRARADLPYIGLIGSRTKWASFRSRLAQRGFTQAELAQVTCPIGVPGVRDKRPEVIAVAVAAQVLQVPDAAQPGGKDVQVAGAAQPD